MLQRSETTAVFQFKRAAGPIKRPAFAPFQRYRSHEIRPGPLQSGMAQLIDRKHGREELHPDVQQHESLKPVLEPTHGIIRIRNR